MLGYWRLPEEDAATWRGEWFTAGDLVAIDADGYVWPRGRADDVMNAGGYRVSPLEVEAAFAGHPAIAEIAVAEAALRPGVTGITAFVVPRAGASANEAEILAHGERELAPYKRPKKVLFVEALPRSANGKLLRRLLVAATQR